MGTTSVWYEGAYNFAKTQEVYKTSYNDKNQWLLALREFLDNEPMIVGGMYFNIDLTNGMSRRVHGEQDRSVLDPISEKVYDGIFTVLEGAVENKTDTSALRRLFGKEFMTINNKRMLVESMYRKQITEVIASVNIQPHTPWEKAVNALDAQKGRIEMNSSLKKYQKNSYIKAIETAKKFYIPDQTAKTPLKK